MNFVFISHFIILYIIFFYIVASFKKKSFGLIFFYSIILLQHIQGVGLYDIYLCVCVHVLELVDEI